MCKNNKSGFWKVLKKHGLTLWFPNRVLGRERKLKKEVLNAENDVY
jgi:hypothetical protein